MLIDWVKLAISAHYDDDTGLANDFSVYDYDDEKVSA